jgi:hypothetical protein
VARRGVHAKLAAQVTDPFLDAQQAEATLQPGLEALSIRDTLPCAEAVAAVWPAARAAMSLAAAPPGEEWVMQPPKNCIKLCHFLTHGGGALPRAEAVAAFLRCNPRPDCDKLGNRR